MTQGDDLRQKRASVCVGKEDAVVDFSYCKAKGVIGCFFFFKYLEFVVSDRVFYDYY